MSQGNPLDGIVTDFGDMEPIPVIQYDKTSNTLIFDNPVQTSGGIASSELAPLSFNPPAVFSNGISAGVNADFFSPEDSLKLRRLASFQEALPPIRIILISENVCTCL